MVNCAGPVAEVRPPSGRRAMTVTMINPMASTPATSHGTRLGRGGGETACAPARLHRSIRMPRELEAHQQDQATAQPHRRTHSRNCVRCEGTWEHERVTERRPDFGDEVGEVGFGDECARPQPFLQVRFREHLQPLEHQRRKQFECLRLEMNLLAGAGQQPALKIERKRTEPMRTADPWTKARRSLEIPWDMPAAWWLLHLRESNASGGLSMRWVLKLVAVIVALTVVHGQAPPPVPATVHTQSGPLRGIGTDVIAFKGIPYAARQPATVVGAHPRRPDGGQTCGMQRSSDLDVPGRRPHARRVGGVGQQAKTVSRSTSGLRRSPAATGSPHGLDPRWRIQLRDGHRAPRRWDQPGSSWRGRREFQLPIRSAGVPGAPRAVARVRTPGLRQLRAA